MAFETEKFYDLSMFKSLSIVRKGECWELEIRMDASHCDEAAVIGKWSACLDAPDVKLTGMWMDGRAASFAFDLGADLLPDPKGIFYTATVINGNGDEDNDAAPAAE